MIGVRGALAAGTIALLVFGGQTPRAALPPTGVWIDLEVEDGRPVLAVRPDPVRDSPFGTPQQRFTVDARELRFTLRPYPGDRPETYAPARQYAASVAKPLPARNGADDVVRLPLSLPAPPRAGMYVVGVQPGGAFARTAGGALIPARFVALSRFGGFPAWWPDERDGDAALRDVRARFANHVVHGFGGTFVGCPGSWSETHGPEPGVRIADVTRASGAAALLRTGSMWPTGGDSAFQFLAVDPIVFQIASPRGVPYRKTDKPGSCDLVWHFADLWHVETTLTTASPPRLQDSESRVIRVGMSRDEVIWRVGYPNQYGTAAAFRKLDNWGYDAPTPFAWSVSFANDRVVTVNPPGRQP